MFSGLKRIFASSAQVKSSALPLSMQSYLYQPGQAVWSERRYQEFSREGYVQNVVAHRAMHYIATAFASVPWKLCDVDNAGRKRTLSQHPLVSLLHKPNMLQNGSAFMEALMLSRLISGNSYMLAVGPQGEAPKELHLLRSDRVSIIAGKDGYPAAYRHTVGDQARDYPVDSVTGRSRILHWKTFHPLNDHYGLSPMEAAAYSIDIHNESSQWNKALLQNGARPSGAMIVKGQEDGPGYLSEEQYYRIKQQMDEQFNGSQNAGRPLLLEGGLEWKEMSHSPKDMDYLEARHSAARDIAQAFGMPPQLLGIPGDNTYSNLAEARLALWEQTILPLLSNLRDALNSWLVPNYPGNLQLDYDIDQISALAIRREKLWQRVKDATFLSDEEKRELLGVGKEKG
jgi:HK97 family phage portal protein